MSHINNKDYFTIPVAIMVSGALIAVSIYLGAREIAGTGSMQNTLLSKTPVATTKTGPAVSRNDHILGSFNAKATIITYTDLECPFCKQFHKNLKTVLADYSPNDVSLVYRAFPLSIHNRAFKEAEAAECAAELGGNPAFWAYIDRIFEITPANNKLDPAELPKIAAYIGLDTKSFESCLSSGRYKPKIEASIKEGAALGAAGTPFSLIVTKTGSVALKGAASVESIKEKLTEALK